MQWMRCEILKTSASFWRQLTINFVVKSTFTKYWGKNKNLVLFHSILGLDILCIFIYFTYISRYHHIFVCHKNLLIAACQERLYIHSHFKSYRKNEPWTIALYYSETLYINIPRKDLNFGRHSGNVKKKDLNLIKP